MGVRKLLPSKLVRGDPPQAGGTPAQPTTGGQAGVPAGPSGLFTSPLCNFVPVPVTVFVPITLSVPAALSPFVSVPVPVSVSVPVSVIVLIPVLSPAVLLALAHIGTFDSLASPLVSGPQPDRLAHQESCP
ncbi:hypothetical protein P4O66_002565 [Electrophorus voltai]|uniref:Uncharacterized protein n=1 Tax=Electrophorus voltai TaxID=2609070 RepID=A0AAD8YXT2_9TELE|nr:hypothetical protein P4O66_002565 [Electrophorus voltai]